MKRRLATIMLIDICGFTALSATTETSKSVSLLQEVETLIIATCESLEGEVIKKVGDGVLVLFPAATKALLAAQKVHTHLQQRDKTSSWTHPTSVKIAIASGDVTLREQEIYGTPVQVVFELEKQASKGTTLLCESTWNILPSGRFRCMPVARHRGKHPEGNRVTFQLIEERRGRYLVAPAAPTQRALASLLDFWFTIFLLLLFNIEPSIDKQFTYWLTRTRIYSADSLRANTASLDSNNLVGVTPRQGSYHIIVGGTFRDTSLSPAYTIEIAGKELILRNSIGKPHKFVKTLARNLEISGNEALRITPLPKSLKSTSLNYIDLLPASYLANPPNILMWPERSKLSEAGLSGISGSIFLTFHCFIKMYLVYLISMQLVLSRTIGGWCLGITIRDIRTKKRIGISATLLRTLACLTTPFWCWWYLGERRQPIDAFSATEAVTYIADTTP